MNWLTAHINTWRINCIEQRTYEQMYNIGCVAHFKHLYTVNEFSVVREMCVVVFERVFTYPNNPAAAPHEYSLMNIYIIFISDRSLKSSLRRSAVPNNIHNHAIQRLEYLVSGATVLFQTVLSNSRDIFGKFIFFHLEWAEKLDQWKIPGELTQE